MMTTVDELMVRLFHPPKILVVQDCAAPVEALLHRNYDCQVDVTTDGNEAARMLAAEKYDLVLIDLVLLNGTSELVLAAARKYRPEVPVVATKVNESNLDQLVEDAGTLTLLSTPVTLNAIERLFRVFKIKAKTREIAAYCTDLTRSSADSPAIAQAG
jgi:CheY-like chemotaxis protein